MVIHNKTIVQTELLIIDDDGNAIDRRVLQQEIYKLLPDEFTQALNQIIQAKEQLEDANSDKSN